MKVNNEVPLWAARELEKLGKLSRNEILLLVFVCFALMMWISPPTGSNRRWLPCWLSC